MTDTTLAQIAIQLHTPGGRRAQNYSHEYAHEGIVEAFVHLRPARRQWLLGKLKAEHLRLENEDAKKATLGDAFTELQSAFKRGMGLKLDDFKSEFDKVFPPKKDGE